MIFKEKCFWIMYYLSNTYVIEVFENFLRSHLNFKRQVTLRFNRNSVWQLPSQKALTISFIIFWDFLMFYQIFLSPQVKGWTIIDFKHGIWQWRTSWESTYLKRYIVGPIIPWPTLRSAKSNFPGPNPPSDISPDQLTQPPPSTGQ